MGFELPRLVGGAGNALVQKQAVAEIMRMETVTARYGLALTEAQAAALVETRTLALCGAGRVEFGGGVVDKLILAFCDSPYLSMENYEETLHGLIEIFYSYKNQTLDLVSDSELIQFMKKAFDGVCQGSLELLDGRELNRFAENLRLGRAYSWEEDAEEADEDREDEDDVD